MADTKSKRQAGSVVDYPSEYDNSGRVADAKSLIDAFWGNAARFREAEGLVVEHGLAYGRNERNRLDMFWPSTDEGRAREVPIVMFVHGGYWRSLDRTAFSHLAYGLLVNNVAVAMPSYTLCPEIEIAGIVNEIRRACLLVYQTYNRKMTVVGHSAGGHLAACMMATDWDEIHPDLPHDLVTSGMGISGLYDLLPLLQTPINDDLKMDQDQALAASPVHWVPEASQVFEAWVGADESDEYHRQSRDLAERWTLLGTPTNYVSVEGANHFTIVDHLTDPLSPMVQRIMEIVDKPKVDFDLERAGQIADEPQEVQAVPEETADELVEKIDAAVEDLKPETEAEPKGTADPEPGPAPERAPERAPQNGEKAEKTDVDKPAPKKQPAAKKKPAPPTTAAKRATPAKAGDKAKTTRKRTVKQVKKPTAANKTRKPKARVSNKQPSKAGEAKKTETGSAEKS